MGSFRGPCEVFSIHSLFEVLLEELVNLFLFFDFPKMDGGS